MVDTKGTLKDIWSDAVSRGLLATDDKGKLAVAKTISEGIPAAMLALSTAEGAHARVRTSDPSGLTEPGAVDAVIDALTGAAAKTGWDALLQLILTATNFMAVSGARYEPALQRIRMDAFSADPNTPIEFASILSLAWRRPDLRAALEAEALKFGVGVDGLAKMIESARPQLTSGDIISAWWRGLIEDGALIPKLMALGYSEYDAEVIRDTAPWVPGPDDVIRWAVRDVFSPAVVDRFDLDEGWSEIAPAVMEWATKVGLTEPVARYFWRAHYELPSISQAFEMLQRKAPTAAGKPFDMDDMDLLMRAADILPYFRPALKAIAYQPITRVDLRRMWRVKIITDPEEMVRRYEALGYSPEDAVALAWFAIKYETGEEKDLTKAEIVKGYKEGMLQRDYCADALFRIGYDEEESEYILALADKEVADASLEDQIEALHLQLLSGVLTDYEARNQLVVLGIPDTRLQRLTLKWAAELAKQSKRPSTDDLKTFLSRGIISPATFRDEMARSGYADRYIDWYIAAAGKRG